ncbi:hypothetical protein [Streptomyces sp. SBT349]|uniref:nSTAND1 domain-containing NTPase n=1 Tax=Streptomyces sp. SBT349 TaxID=1580539 RepID=UPI00066BB987|nr:hypothetical protein [Streptomyces sp. SBT349]
MGRPERALDPEAGPVERFAFDLRQLRVAAGKVSYRALSRRAHFSVTALSEAAAGHRLPSLEVTLAYVRACGGDVTDWEERWRKLAAAQHAESPDEDPPPAADAPYLGLATFEPGDAEWFFGRERLVARLCARLESTAFLAVFGASGAGKSSVLRAGLLPAVANATAAEGGAWPTALLVPGARPLEELAIRLANLGGVAASSLHGALRAEPDGIRLVLRQVLAERSEKARVLIVVDQFEEVFTLCRDQQERDRFIDCLVAAAQEPRGRVVLGVRADFYARCAEHAGLVAVLDGHHMLVGPMNEEDLRSVVTGPAGRAGIRVEAELVEAVVADAHGQPGALPLVSHALRETWRRRRGVALTPAGYRAAGGVRGAIAQSAERVYGNFDAEQRRVAAALFLRLTAPGDGTEDTRRRAPRAEFLGGTEGRAVAAVLDRLIAARLVTADEDTVTVAHEALIRNWPRLAAWLAEDRDLLRAHRRLTDSAAEWHLHGEDEALLYRGVRLAGWRSRPLDRLNARESAFLEASRVREAAERTAERRRVRLTVTGLGTVLLVVSVLAGVAAVQADQAARERRVAHSRQLAAEARGQLQVDPERGLRTALRAYRVSPTAQADAALRQAVADDRMLAVVSGGRERVLGVAISPDGTRLADTDSEGTVRVSRLSGGAVSDAPSLVLRGHGTEAWSPAFSPDGTRLATAGLDGTVRVWDLGGGEPLVLRGHRGPVWNVAFSPDGTRLAGAGDDGTVRVWNASGQGEPLVLRGHRGPAVGVAFSPDGRHLASSGHDRTIRIWDVSGRGEPRVLRGHEDAVKTLAFSPDGTLLASASIDGTARVWDTEEERAPVVLRDHDGTVEGLAFGPDGHLLATTSDDGTVRVWNADGRSPPLVLRGHRETVWAAAFSPDGTRLASAGDDGTVRVWDPRGPGRPLTLGRHTGEAWTAALSADGRRVVSGGADGTVRVWDADGRSDPLLLRGHGGPVLSVATDSPGRRVAAAGEDDTVRVWDTAGSDGPRLLRGHGGSAWSVALSADGRRVATTGDDGAVRVWDAADAGEPRILRGHRGYAWDVAFSPDGRRLVTSGEDGTVRVWDLAGGADPLILRGHGGLPFAVAFTPDGQRVVSAGDDGTVRVWDTTGTGRPLVLRGHQGFVWNIAISPEGRWIASTGKDGTVRVWDAEAVEAMADTAEPVVLTGFAASVEGLAFQPDDGRLVTTHGDGTVRLWHCDTCASPERILTLADQRIAQATAPAPAPAPGLGSPHP